MARSVLALTFSLLLTGCYGAYQVKADHPTGAGTLMPTVEDKDAGLVGIASGFGLKSYQVIAISLFPVTDLAVKDEGDRRTAASMSAFFHSELVRRMRESGLFTRVSTSPRPRGSRARRRPSGSTGASAASARAPRSRERSSASTAPGKPGPRATWSSPTPRPGAR